MAVYMVERDLPGVTMDQLAAAQKAAIECTHTRTFHLARPIATLWTSVIGTETLRYASTKSVMIARRRDARNLGTRAVRHNSLARAEQDRRGKSASPTSPPEASPGKQRTVKPSE